MLPAFATNAFWGAAALAGAAYTACSFHSSRAEKSKKGIAIKEIRDILCNFIKTDESGLQKIDCITTWTRPVSEKHNIVSSSSLDLFAEQSDLDENVIPNSHPLMHTFMIIQSGDTDVLFLLERIAEGIHFTTISAEEMVKRLRGCVQVFSGIPNDLSRKELCEFIEYEATNSYHFMTKNCIHFVITINRRVFAHRWLWDNMNDLRSYCENLFDQEI